MPSAQLLRPKCTHTFGFSSCLTPFFFLTVFLTTPSDDQVWFSRSPFFRRVCRESMWDQGLISMETVCGFFATHVHCRISTQCKFYDAQTGRAAPNSSVLFKEPAPSSPIQLSDCACRNTREIFNTWQPCYSQGASGRPTQLEGRSSHG